MTLVRPGQQVIPARLVRLVLQARKAMLVRPAPQARPATLVQTAPLALLEIWDRLVRLGLLARLVLLARIPLFPARQVRPARLAVAVAAECQQAAALTKFSMKMGSQSRQTIPSPQAVMLAHLGLSALTLV